jgi:hypothetical protein
MEMGIAGSSAMAGAVAEAELRDKDSKGIILDCSSAPNREGCESLFPEDLGIPSSVAAASIEI